MTQMKLPKIEKMPADVRALGALRSQIVDGSIPPGSRLTEVQLSEGMGLSRATVRTALHQLGKEGLVSLVPYTGWTVVELTHQDVWELYTLRGAIERLAAQFAATSADMESMLRIEGAFERLKDTVGEDSEKIAEADFGFHKSIVDASSHSRLKQQYKLIEQQIRVFIRSSNLLIEDPAEIIAQHEPIWNAIRQRNADFAGTLAEQHNITEGQKLTGSLPSA
ncbi:GntR family transcriptional regulator [Mesorhizobium sp. B2-4-17]|uniref:GntR family transcriptional regulator n=2 Tax=unclassified Mesorhizobium TaxID=325217 RepID=UPI00112DFB9C|nr:GntR family transcriptional regulator [Mesorhizobium sp. B2-4-17]TPK85461.1 GntR family transcriptional regulator [Mesorhizobium sp. B2-4-17]TPK99843.1 GntR family transcriptional regulator [Mesorhizobium sp. B2-4-14]